MKLSPLQVARYQYSPKLPGMLRNGISDICVCSGGATESVADQEKIKALFPNTYGKNEITFQKGKNTSAPKKQIVGVILSGGEAPACHNVICGLYDALKACDKENVLYGFKGGPSGLLEDNYVVFDDEYINQYRNTGGFDIIGSGRTKLETEEQFAVAEGVCKKHGITAIVIIGGLKKVSKVCEKLVPVMAIFYVACCLVIIGMNGAYLWDAIVTIITCAFTGQAAFGGAVGSGIMLALQYGFKRGLFSNESGLGSAPLVAASAISKNPARQALVSMSGTFWDTVVICLITGLMLVTSLLANPDLAAIYNNTMLASNDLSIDTAVGIFSGGAALATACFESIPVLGPLVLVVGLLCFTYSTMLGWSQYGDRAITYLFGTKGIRPYQVVFLLFVFWGCIGGGDLVWNLSDISNALMAIPNCIAVLVLSGVIAKGTKYWIYEGRLEEEDTTPIPTVGTVDHPNV